MSFSDRVSNILLNHIKPSTRSSYALKWSRFLNWLKSSHISPTTADLPTVFEFLLSLKDAGLSHSSIRVYLAALSAYHVKVDSFTLFSHPLSKQFLRGLLKVYPSIKTKPVPWDLPLVLRCLTKPPFEPAATTELRLLSWKVLFLVAVTSARRVGELAALDIRQPYLVFLPHSVRLTTNVTFLPKVVSEFHMNSAIILPDFYPEPKNQQERLLHSLDVTRALKFYLHRKGQ